MGHTVLGGEGCQTLSLGVLLVVASTRFSVNVQEGNHCHREMSSSQVRELESSCYL